MNITAGNLYIQSNLNSSNTDGSFTMADSNSFLSPYEILPTTLENKYLRKFSFLSWNCMLCVLHRIASMRRFYGEHTTNNYMNK